MKKVWENTKIRRWLIILGLGLAAVFAFFYLRYVFQTGIWYSNIFWKRSRDVDAGWYAEVNGDAIELIRRVTDDGIEVSDAPFPDGEGSGAYGFLSDGAEFWTVWAGDYGDCVFDDGGRHKVEKFIF